MQKRKKLLKWNGRDAGYDMTYKRVSKYNGKNIFYWVLISEN